MRYLILGISLFLSFDYNAQVHFCNTTEKQNSWFEKHPELKVYFDQLQEQARVNDSVQYQSGHQERTSAVAIYTIPVVFHILHKGGAENISDAQVIDAVDILNRDFNKLNADTSNVVLPFKTLIGDTKFVFQLATKDPNGICTNSIIRHYDVNTNWIGNFSDYQYTWNPTRYLNFYVVKSISSGAAGYTYLPGSGIPSALDAIVILSSYVGSIGSGNAGSSRALTHEVGHWFNLPHVWGGTNQPGVACGDDGVSDTPITKGFTSCSLNNTKICNPAIDENIQNYMDYAYCQVMFTKGQSSRMQNSINSPISGRNNLSSLNNLSITGITNPGINCIPKLEIAVSPSYSVCQGHSLAFNSYTYNSSPTSYSWTANNAAVVSNSTLSATHILFNNAGSTTISCVVSNINGNSIKSIVIYVLNGITNYNSTNSQSFESLNLPSFWSVINPTTPNNKWDIFSGAGSQGSKCMYIQGELLEANSIEILETPSYDFKNNQGAIFTFKYAYARKDANNKDFFKVQGSKDCGGSWEDIWLPNNGNLANSSGGTTAGIYVPFFDWGFYNLTLHPNFQSFVNEDHVNFRFYFQEDVGGVGMGNRFYLDEINFTTPVGINELTKSIGFNVYPNPTSDIFNLQFTLSNSAKIKYQIQSITGSTFIEESEQLYLEGEYKIILNKNKSLAKGIYFLNLEMNGIKMSRKLVVN